MMMRNATRLLKRMALLATIATFAVTMSQPSMAAPASTSKTSAAKTPTAITAAGKSDVTDFSSQRRRYARRGGGYDGAAVGAAVAGIVGSAIIASQADRGYGYGYSGGPYDSYAYSPGYGGGYDGGGPGYYGGGYGPDRSQLGGQGGEGRLLRNW